MAQVLFQLIVPTAVTPGVMPRTAERGGKDSQERSITGAGAHVDLSGAAPAAFRNSPENVVAGVADIPVDRDSSCAARRQRCGRDPQAEETDASRHYWTHCVPQDGN